MGMCCLISEILHKEISTWRNNKYFIIFGLCEAYAYLIYCKKVKNEN